jgi:hypothetical protein
LRVGLLAAGLEGLQAVLPAHVCSLQDALVAIAGTAAGSAAGAWAGQASTARRRGLQAAKPESRGAGGWRKWAVVALVAATAYAGAAGWRRAAYPAASHRRTVVHWVPFEQHFRVSFPRAVSDAAQQMALYGSVTLVCLALTRGRGRAVALISVLGLSGAGELYRVLVAGHDADVTAPLLAAAAGLLAVRIWQAIYPQPGASKTEAPAPT